MSTKPAAKKVFPVGMLAEGRPCAVVGGGKVALRKAELLLAAGADVMVISPDLHEDLARLVGEGAVRHVARGFEAGDVDGCCLVFAATNDIGVNTAVLKACRDCGIPACSVDKTWTQGDFITPATFRKGDITVAVSTGGRSCRRSRLVKDSLARHVDTVETAGLLVMGTSHNYLSLDEREPFHLAGERSEAMAGMLDQVWGLHEFAILNTCNRAEMLAVVTRDSAIESILKRILGYDHLGDDKYYVKRDHEAFAHLAVAMAGLLSQTPGENHIVAQVKDSVSEAVEHGWAGGMMQEWLSSALHVQKHIRAAIAPLLHGQEIEDLCLKYLAAECGDWESRNIMVVGTGVIGQGLVRRLVAEGHKVIWCAHRTEPEIPAGSESNVRLCNMNELRDRVAEVNAIITATAGQGHVLHTGHAPFFDQEHEILIVDLAMPRNVAPELGGLTGHIRVVDLDDLKHWYRREMADMSRAFELGKETVAEHRGMYDKLTAGFTGNNAE